MRVCLSEIAKGLTNYSALRVKGFSCRSQLFPSGAAQLFPREPNRIKQPQSLFILYSNHVPNHAGMMRARPNREWAVTIASRTSSTLPPKRGTSGR